jgi:hypothetical protein
MAEIMIVATIAVFLSAAGIRFLHHIIGSPAGNEYETGRIFSAYGRFVSDNYTKHHNKETVRIYAKFDAWKAQRQERLQSDLQNADKDTAIAISAVFSEEVEDMLTRVETWRRPNPWKAAGACLICFSTWAACFLWCILIPVISVPVLLFPLLVASTVVVGNRIEI